MFTMSGSRIVLITGGSRGLGKDMALSIARKGMDVVITYRSKKEEAEETVKQVEALGQRAIALPLDMNEPVLLDAFVALFREALQKQWKVSTFDFLVNNAGIG